MAPTKSIGVVCAKSFSDTAKIRSEIEKGVEHLEDYTWILHQKPTKGSGISIVNAVLSEHGIEPFVAPLLPYWNGPDKDRRSDWRDGEFSSTCERVIVFHHGNTTKPWAEAEHTIARIYVIEP